MGALSTIFRITFLMLMLVLTACGGGDEVGGGNGVSLPKNPTLTYTEYSPTANDIVINRTAYKNKLYGFWLGQNIANWTGIVTELDKIGNHLTGPFYTRDDWGTPDLRSYWEANPRGNLIEFIFRDENEIWRSDDDTDIEYIYQHLLYENQTSILSGEQIRDGWLNHIRSNEDNSLWVSNETAFRLMESGMVPPDTGDSLNNKDWEMIDAQLTTEIFGLFSPTRPNTALEMSLLPIQNTARGNAQWISEFYVVMHSLASSVDTSLSMKDQVFWLAEKARQRLPEGSYSAAMYDYVKAQYESGALWETTRDNLYTRYQVNEMDSYEMNIAARGIPCDGCFASGINFAAGMVSLFYGEGDYKETVKIGTLSGWDSDNPTATWGGLLGFLLGKDGVEAAFGRKFSSQYNILATRINFNDLPGATDNFDHMAEEGIYIIDRVVQEQLGGGVDLTSDTWHIPDNGTDVPPGS